MKVKDVLIKSKLPIRQLENLTLIEYRIVAYLADFSFMNSALILLSTAFYKKFKLFVGIT